MGLCTKIASSAALAILLANCSHAQPPKQLSHDAGGCSEACPLATTVEISANKAMCRCSQAQYGFQYTFKFPETPEELDHAHGRWFGGVSAAMACQREGMEWEAAPDGSGIQCVKPTLPEHTSLMHSYFPPRFISRPAWMQWVAPKRRA